MLTSLRLGSGVPLVDASNVDLITAWSWCAIGWCIECWPHYGLVLVCDWLMYRMLTSLRLGPDMPLVDVSNVDLITAWSW